MSLLKSIQNLDRRWIYLLCWIFVMYPLIFPLGLPIPINQQAKDWDKAVTAIKPGSTVIFAPMYDPSGIPELFPMTVATFRQLMSMDVKVIVVTFWAAGPMVFNQVLAQVDPAGYKKVYGTDWINLGYIPGTETAMASFGKDLAGTASQDVVERKPTSSFPIMQNIKSATDITLIISIETGTPGATEWLRQWNTPYKTPIIVGCIGVSAPGMMPFVQSGQISALLPGLTSSAEYEQILKQPGLATAGVDAVSMSHLLVVLLVVIGNVAFLAYRGSSKGGK